MEDRETVVVIENAYKNYTHSFDDGVYLAQVNDMDGSEFQDAVIRGSVAEDFALEPVGTIPVPVYRVLRK